MRIFGNTLVKTRKQRLVEVDTDVWIYYKVGKMDGLIPMLKVLYMYYLVNNNNSIL